jgi:hypothetical protein
MVYERTPFCTTTDGPVFGVPVINHWNTWHPVFCVRVFQAITLQTPQLQAFLRVGTPEHGEHFG